TVARHRRASSNCPTRSCHARQKSRCSMTLGLYQASVPVFQRYLARLQALLDTAEVFVHAQGLEPETLLVARLVPDMMPLHMQVLVATTFTLRAAFPRAGSAVPDDAQFPPTFDGLRALVARARTLLASLEPASFDDDRRVIESRAGDAIVSLPAPEF